MVKPVILAVDDDAEVLGAVERDLKQHYRSDYRVLKAGSGAEALEAARQLKERGSPVALFLVDERMPGMSGTELLREAIKLHPDSRRVLLTAYADTQAAISGINDVGLDHYLLKPWDPPGERLYPVLDDLLSDWTARVRLPYDGIRVAGARSSPRSYGVKEFLSSNHVPYQWIDVDQDPPTRELIRSAGDATRLPVVFFPDGTRLVAPTNRELAEKVGMQTRALLPFYDLAIVGGGPAGLAAAVYAASEGLRTVLIEQSAPGGQAGTSSKIENYLGFPSGISGADLARRAAAQARRFGAEVIAQEAVSVRREDPYRVVRLADGTDLSCKAVVLAMGVSVRMLEVPGVEALLGIGVYYGAAMTEAATYRAQDVCIVGAGNSAGQGALFFSRYARRVTMLVRGASLAASMSRYLIDRIAATPNIDVVTGAEVTAVCGTGRLEKVVVRRAPGGEVRETEAAAMFIFIGARPRTEMLAGLLELDEKGYVRTGHDLAAEGRRPRGWTLDRDPFAFETSVPGVFAAGDVRAGSSKRVAAAVGEGSGTVGVVHTYLETV
ncbi:MAG TPA: FAD-dependent oxidoreductase [Thermoanaerobaculia bacterium]|nr:FAD-dependent oxidoreductase [Thermoanaerobaculia bacterium]